MHEPTAAPDPHAHPDPGTLWKHRRRHSYLALSALLLQTAALIAIEPFRPGTVAGLEPLIAPAYTAECLIVLAYIANCAVEAYIDRRPK